jgi:hypothetical protein
MALACGLKSWLTLRITVIGWRSHSAVGRFPSFVVFRPRQQA